MPRVEPVFQVCPRSHRAYEHLVSDSGFGCGVKLLKHYSGELDGLAQMWKYYSIGSSRTSCGWFDLFEESTCGTFTEATHERGPLYIIKAIRSDTPSVYAHTLL